MKIAIIRGDVRDICAGNYNNQEIGLAKALADLGHCVHIYTPWHVFQKNKIYKNVTVHYRKYKKVPVVDHYIMDGMRSILKSNSYDVVHCNDENSFNTLYYASMIKNQKLVIYHGMYEVMNSRALKVYESIHNFLFSKIIRSKNPTVFGKTSAAENFLRLKGYQNATTLPIGLDTNNFKSLITNDTLSISEREKNVLYVGVLEKRRNINFILKLAQKEPNLNFKIIGDGPEKELIRHEISDKKLKNITIIENVNQIDLPIHYLESGLLILPSSYEIFGMVLIEALYFGLPVLSTPTAGAKDIVIPKAGELAELDENIWRKKIVSILENPERYSPQEVFRENYTWEKIAKKYIELVTKNV